MQNTSLGNCLNLFVNLIISNLFTGSITSLIELIRIFSTNILTKYIISENSIRNYGIYLQPAITCVLLFVIGMSSFYFIQWTAGTGDFEDSQLFVYLMYFFVAAITLAFVAMFIFYIFKINKEKKVLRMPIGYKEKCQ